MERVVALLVAGALLAAACASTSSGDSADAGDSAGAGDSADAGDSAGAERETNQMVADTGTAAATEAVASSTTPTSTSIAVEAVRAADIVVDTDRCPADPSPQDGPIRIGTNGGGFVASDHVAVLQAAFDRVNAEGGIGGRPIELVTAIETQGDGPNVQLHITELLDRGDLQAIIPWAGLPDPTPLADEFDRRCIPGLFWLGTSAPSNRWVVPGLGDRRAQLAAMAHFLNDEVGAGHVLVLPVDWPSEVSVAETLVTALAGRGDTTVTVVPQDPQRPQVLDLGTDTERLVDQVDAVVIPTPGANCWAASQQVKERLPDALIMVSWLCQPFGEPDFASMDGVHRLRWIAGHGSGAEDYSYGGDAVAETTAAAVVAVLESANRLDGGVTRANILRAADALRLVVPPLHASDPDDRPMVIRTAGPADRFALESAAVEVFEQRPSHGGPAGWNLTGHIADADGATPVTEIDWTEPKFNESPFDESEGASFCVSPGGNPEIFTTHWFPNEVDDGSAVDRLSDIILYVNHIDLGPDPGAVLVATGTDGVTVRLEMTRGGGGSGCDGEVFFDIVLGDAGAINQLSFPVAVHFEVGTVTTGAVTWPDDFPLAPPFGNVALEIEPN